MSLASFSSLSESRSDVLIFVNDSTIHLGDKLHMIEKSLFEYEKINPKLPVSVELLPLPDHPCGRMIFASTGKLNGDVDDIRNIYDAAVAGVKKALSLKCRSPLLILGPLATLPKDVPWAEADYPLLNAILGALHALYQPLELREATGLLTKYDKLGVFEAQEKLLEIAFAIEEGRRISRDIGGSDPERMSAPNIADFIQSEFGHVPNVSVKVDNVTTKEYPLMAAVNRGAAHVERHDGRIVHLEYTSSTVDTTLFIVGKGITYDTGGCDVKAGGVMAGMHRDKCGAAAVVGFFKTLSLLKPKGLRVCGSMAFVRNSIGSRSYVADEIITSRAGKRVRVGNTDAEGRMVMTDLLCEAKEMALDAVNPFLFTWATLTGHVIRAYKFYTAVMDNGPARKHKVAQSLQKAGERISDMAEISTVRKEDYEMCRGHTEYEDLLQCNNLASSATPRGHQFPAAFMTMASGLDAFGLDADQQIPYTHVDVAGSAGLIDTLPTAAPMMMFTSMYVLPRI